MVGNLRSRLDALEHESQPGFTGYACVEVNKGQTVAGAKAAWIADNGPVGDRQVVLLNFGGYNSEEWRKLCA